jgi:hypothetical protein
VANEKKRKGSKQQRQKARARALEAARPRRALGAGAVTLCVGLAIVGVSESSLGAAVCLAGLLLTIYAIHSFGRLGFDAEPQRGG